MTTRENPSGGDNEQRSSEARLGWIGGIIDGEGMVTAIRRNTKAKTGYIPRVSIVNTDPTIISEAASILKELSIPHYVQHKAGKGNWKDKWEIIIGGMKRNVIALPILIPYLVSKREKAEALLAFCERRLALPPNSPYTTTDYELLAPIRVNETKPLNRSTTTRLAPISPLRKTLNTMRNEHRVMT